MTAPNTTNNVTVRKLANVAEGMWNKSKNAFVNASGDTMTGRLTMENVPINQIVTGTGTAATSSSSGGTTTYYPAKWNFDLGIATPSAGDQLVIKIPVAGHDNGVWISTDNGITYFPVARNYGTSRLTAHYPNGAYICVVFETYIASNTNSGAVNDVYPVAGGTSRINPRIGCWRVLNDYDSGNTYDRLYNSNGRFRTGSTGCYPYSLVCLDNTESYSMLVTSNPGTGTNKNVNTAGKFVFPASILYYAGNNTTAAGALVSSTYATYVALSNFDVRYSSNHTTTFTTHKPVYIECTLNGDGTWSPTSNSITQTLRTGYYYIYLGIAYSTEYQVSLAPEHPLYYYDGTNLVSAEVARGDITSGTNNGELNVAGTDITVYTHPTDAGNKHIPAGGSSGQFLGYDSDGTAKWVSNPNTDTKVKATAKTDNANYKILATASASPTSGAATEAVYDTDITLNPSTNTISANVSGTAASAGKLTTARTTYVTLGTASTSTTRDWSGTTTIPVSGTLGLGNGGTGATSAAGARTNLDVYSKSETESLLNGKVVVVTQLPATGESGVTYYVKDTSSSAVDKYDEYIWAKDAGASTESWIHVGEKSIDLSNYVNALSTSGSGPLVASLSKSGNTLTATMGTISIDDLSDWATDTDVTVSSVTYHTWWPVAPTSSNQVYGLSIYNGRLYRIYNNKGTYSAQAYDTNTTYTNKSLGQGYGTCATEAATAAKIVTMSEYALTTGGIVTVKFTNALCASATMNINGKGAKPIYIKGAAVTANNAATVSAGDTAYFMYDGTAYHLLGTDRAATNPIVNISRSGTTFTATRLDGSTFNFTQQDNNTTYTQAKLGQGYGTCTTAEATAAKSVTLTGYELETNGVVAVKFTNGLCASATMSINGKTATPIYINGAAVTTTSCKEVLAGDLAFFIYDGSHYQFICTDRISKNGITGLSISGRTITYTRADGSTGTLTTQDTTYTFDGVYNSSSNKAATVSTVTNAVNALDVDDITGFGAGKTLKTLTETDGKIAATFQDISITKSQVSDFSHAHGNITNDGKIGTTANLPVITGTSGSVTTGSFATSTVAVDTSSSAGTANTFSRGDHKHSISLATGDAPGQVKIAGTNVTVQGWDNKQSYYDATFTRSYRNVSNCWAKLASMSLDLSANSEVSGAWEIFASGQWAQVGIVNFHTKITANETTSSYSENSLYWIGDTAAINSGYNFCMVLKPKAASGQPVVMELWGQCTTRYQGIGIREIGGTGTSAERDPAHTWVYYNPTDNDMGAKPSATEGTVIVDPVPHTQTKSVLKTFTLTAGQMSYVKIMMPTGQHQNMVVYSADGPDLHGECILRTYNDGSPSSNRCQVLALGGNPRRWFGKANEQYIEFDWTAESSNRAFRFGITELSGGDSVNFELVDTLPSGTVEITPTRITPASHTHGNITNDGKVGTTADYAVVTTTGGAVTATSLATSSPTTSGNTLEFIDTVSQNSKGKISATKKKVTIDDTYSSTGTNPVSGKAVAAAIETLDVTEVGGDGKYIKKIKEDNGKITATVETMDTTPTASSTKAVTSGGIKTALDEKADDSDVVHIAGTETITGRKTFSDNAIFSSVHRDTYYASNVCRYFRTNKQPTQIVIWTKIGFESNIEMPKIRLYGYAYRMSAPFELNVVFYVYNNEFTAHGVTSTGGMKAACYLWKYTDNTDNKDYIAIGLQPSTGQTYFLGFQVDVQVGASGAFYSNRFSPEGWTVADNGDDTSVTLIPSVGTDKCVQVNAKPISTDISGNAATATQPKVTVLTNADDLDSIRATNVGDILTYRWTSGSYPAHVPYTGTSCVMQVINNASTNYVKQIVYASGLNKIYERACINNSWSTWKTFLFDSDVTSTYSSTGTDPVNGTAVAAALGTLDVASAGGDGKYIKAISETDGKISATAETMDTTPTASSTKAVTSGGVKTALDGKAASSHTHGNITNGGTLTDTAAAAAGNDYVVIRDADNAKIQTSTIKGTDVADAVSKKHSHSTLTLSTTAQAYDGSHTLALPSTDPYTSARTPASHSHGNITNDGSISSDGEVAISNNCSIVYADNTGKVKRSTVKFDGSTSTKALTQKGTFESFANSDDITTAIQALDVSSVGGDGKYIKAISETDGKISATVETMDTTPTASSTKAVTSGGIKTALDGKLPIYKLGSEVPSSQDFVCLRIKADYVSGVNKSQVLLYDITSFADGTINENDAAYVGFEGFLIGGKPQGGGEVICVKICAKVAYGQITGSSEWRTLKSDSSTCGPEIIKRTENGVDKYYLSIFYDSTLYNGNDVLVGQFRWRAPSGISVYSYQNGVIGEYKPNQTYPANEPLWDRIQTFTSNIHANTSTKLAVARKLKTNLARTADSTFDGSSDQENIPVTGTLPVANGGTGKTTVTAAEYNLLSKMGTDLSANEILDNYRFVFASPSPSEANGRLGGFRTATAVWSWIKDKLASDTNVDISGHADSATYDGNGNTISDNSVYYVAGTTDYAAWQANKAYAVNDTVNYSNQIRVCKTAHTSGSSYDSSKWNDLGTPVLKGTISGITALYTGLKIAYKWPCTGGSSSTYLNINGLGNVYIRRNDGNMTTHVPVNTVTFLAYDGTYWRWADYDSNTNNWVTTMGAYCDTAAATAAKVATSTNTVLTAGMSFLIRIVNANTSAGKLTLNINSQGAKDVWINGAVSSSSNYTLPAGEHWCHYNGSVFHIWTDGTAHFTKLHLDTPLPDAEIASAATWNAKQDAITYMTVAQENELISELGDL